MRIEFLHKIYWGAYDFFWRTYALAAPKAATKSRYKMRMGYVPNLSSPKTLNEKMQYLKLNDYWKNPVVIQCTDKYAVREYVTQKGCPELLNELYATYNNASEIEWDELPNEFVIKCNHGSGSNFICHDKTTVNVAETTAMLDKWMHNNFGLERVEFSYEGIPRKLICEKMIKTEDGLPPKDYKIFCSYGTPKLLFVASDRYDNKTKFDYFTPDWEWIPVKNGHPNAGPEAIKKPKDLDKMLEYASKLSSDFPLVRVDFYYEFGKIIFGELTFLHFGGVTPFEPKEYDRKFGDLFPLIINK